MLLTNNRFQDFSPENKLMLCAASAEDFREIIQLATDFLDASIIVADALHYIITRTNDLDCFDKEASWLDLISAGILPPMRLGTPDAPPHPPGNKLNTLLGSNIAVHFSIPTESGKYCTMFDLMDNSNIALKLTLTTEHPMNFVEQQRSITLATAVHNAYYRLGIGSRNDAKEHYLRELIFNTPDSRKALSTPNEFDTNGTFRLASFLISGLGIHNFAFVSEFSHLIKLPNVLVTRIGDTLNILYNQSSGTYDLQGTLDSIARKYSVSVLLSDSFTDLLHTRQAYEDLQAATRLFSHFENAGGIQTPDTCHMFQMFEQLYLSERGRTYMMRDAEMLFSYDEKKKTQYSLTAYCYLLHNCEAPTTADLLFIHRNTLDKRLRKIETMISADWHLRSYQFRMLYSLFCLFYEKGNIPFFRPQHT